MKVKRKDDFIDIVDIHPNDYFLLDYIVSTIYNLLKDNELDTISDNQEKERMQKHLEELLVELSKEMGTKTAESWDETPIRKVLEKISQKNK